MALKHAVKNILPKPLVPLARLAFLYAAAGKTFVEEALKASPKEPFSLPGMFLRYRVHGRLDRKSFLQVGETCAENIKSALQSIGKDLYSFRNILDFGCGCARVLRYFHDHPDSVRFYGTDIDAEAVMWCKKNIPFSEFAINEPLPPLSYGSEHFDFLYAISIFTHLDEEYQFSWLKEFLRIMKPGGLLLLTTHGDAATSKLTPRDQKELTEKGFLFKIETTGKLKADGLPDFYQNAYHTKEYVIRTWSQFFTIKTYIERGMNNHQDIIILEKKV